MNDNKNANQKLLSQILELDKLNPVQGTKEWIDYRLGIVGGSEMYDTINNPRKVIQNKLFTEDYKPSIITNNKSSILNNTINIVTGKIFEKMGRYLLEFIYKTKIYELGINKSQNAKNKGYSADGLMLYDDNFVLIEIKTICTRKIIHGEVYELYLPQILSGLSDFDYINYGIYIECKYKICTLNNLLNPQYPLYNNYKSGMLLYINKKSICKTQYTKKIVDEIIVKIDQTGNQQSSEFCNLLIDINNKLIIYKTFKIGISDQNIIQYINKENTNPNYIGMIPFYYDDYNIVKVDKIKDYSKQYESRFEYIIQKKNECIKFEIIDEIDMHDYLDRREFGDLKDILFESITKEMFEKNRFINTSVFYND